MKSSPQQIDMFAGEASLDAPVVQTGEDGSIPIPPLQPKELRLETISRETAAYIWINKHYLHRDVPSPSLEIGVFDKNHTELVGAICFSARLGGSKKGGAPHIWEIRRMWLSDQRCARNSESRVLRIACRIVVPRIAPHVKQIISYSDLEKMGHRGTIYRASGFSYYGMTKVNPKGDGWGTHNSHVAKDNWPKKRWVLNL